MAKQLAQTVIIVPASKITPDTVRDILHKSEGRFVVIEFTKKDGEKRKMVCQPATMAKRIVPDHEASESAKRGAETRRILHPNLIPVWDAVNAQKMLRDARKNGKPEPSDALMRTACARSINTDTITRITSNGIRLEVKR